MHRPQGTSRGGQGRSGPLAHDREHAAVHEERQHGAADQERPERDVASLTTAWSPGQEAVAAAMKAAANRA